MYTLREGRVHITQGDFDLAISKVLNKYYNKEGRSVFGSVRSRGAGEARDATTAQYYGQ